MTWMPVIRAWCSFASSTRHAHGALRQLGAVGRYQDVLEHRALLRSGRCAIARPFPSSGPRSKLVAQRPRCQEVPRLPAAVRASGLLIGPRHTVATAWMRPCDDRSLLTGDINLMNVTDPGVPFARVGDTLRSADVRLRQPGVLLLRSPPASARSPTKASTRAPAAGRALKLGGFHAVGNANNVNYGAEAIRSSLADARPARHRAHRRRQQRREAARAPAIVERKGMRVGFLQRTSVYWPTNHEAGEHSPGVAALRGHTAYQLPLHKTRPEIPPDEPPRRAAGHRHLGRSPSISRATARTSRRCASACDIVVASHHWGLDEDVLEYMTEIAHAAIDAGADIVDRPRTALLAAGRDLQGQADLLRPGQLLVPHRPRRAQARRLGRHAGARRRWRSAASSARRSASCATTSATKPSAAMQEEPRRWRSCERSAAFATRIEVEGDEGVLRPSDSDEVEGVERGDVARHRSRFSQLHASLLALLDEPELGQHRPSPRRAPPSSSARCRRCCGRRPPCRTGRAASSTPRSSPSCRARRPRTGSARGSCLSGPPARATARRWRRCPVPSRSGCRRNRRSRRCGATTASIRTLPALMCCSRVEGALAIAST